MCGIVGAIGDAEAGSVLYGALQRLEYRGYDSSGIVLDHDGELVRRRATGKLKELGAVMAADPITSPVPAASAIPAGQPMAA